MFGLVSIEDKRWLQDVIELTWLTYYLKVQFESSVHLNLSLSLIWGYRIDLFLPLQVCAAVCIFSQVPIYCLRHKNCQASTLCLLTLTFTQLIFSLFMMHGRLYYKWEQITDSHLPNRKLICFFFEKQREMWRCVGPCPCKLSSSDPSSWFRCILGDDFDLMRI